jgi:hypothetical protein
MDDLQLWQVLKILEGADRSKARLIKQDGNKYKVVDDEIVSADREHSNVKLVVNFEDKWRIVWI